MNADRRLLAATTADRYADPAETARKLIARIDSVFGPQAPFVAPKGVRPLRARRTA